MSLMFEHVEFQLVRDIQKGVLWMFGSGAQNKSVIKD